MGFIKKLIYIVAVLAIIFVMGLCLGFFGSNYISDNLLTDPEAAASGNMTNETTDGAIASPETVKDAIRTNEPIESATPSNEPEKDTVQTTEQTNGTVQTTEQTNETVQTTEQTNETVQATETATETVQAMDLLSRDAIPAKGLENEPIPTEMQEIDEEQEEQEIENKPTIVPKPESDALIENSGPLTVCGNKENLEVNGEFVFMPVRRVFEPAEFDTTVGSGIRLRNTDTKSKSKLLIHSPEGYFKDYQLNPNHDMFIVFNEAGTYEFELYSFENSKDADGDGDYEELVAFGYYGEVTVENINGNPVTKEEYVELPSVLTVTVDEYRGDIT